METRLERKKSCKSFCKIFQMQETLYITNNFKTQFMYCRHVSYTVIITATLELMLRFLLHAVHK